MTYRTKVQEQGEEVSGSKDPANDTMNCPLCHGLTKRGALSIYGARCFRCFDAYCTAPFRKLEPSGYAMRVKAEIQARGKA
jgi:hypothetical protein